MLNQKTHNIKHPKHSGKCRGFFSMPRVVNRFKKDEEGATAIEFAMVGLPFFMLLFAIIESSLHFFAGQLLESAVDQTARMVRTGQLDADSTEAQFRAEVCERAIFLFDCDGLNIDLSVEATFDDLEDPPEPVAGEIDASAYNYDSPGPEQVIMITVQYEWPIITNFVQSVMSDLNSGNALLSAVAVFRSEPFPT